MFAHVSDFLWTSALIGDCSYDLINYSTIIREECSREVNLYSIQINEVGTAAVADRK